ncbi:hypothetical protein KAI87_04595, partial [Myxococcota bacterium]|nr:hypothetical protein [Myxococcota bacterium]
MDVGCDLEQICPETTERDDRCEAEGSFIPCASGGAVCDDGCRTCTDGHWGGCETPECYIWQTDSCSFCGDNCFESILNAEMLCKVSDGVARCDYLWCFTDYVDADGDRQNGCEAALPDPLP